MSASARGQTSPAGELKEILVEVGLALNLVAQSLNEGRPGCETLRARLSVPFDGGATDGPDLACARSVAVVSRPRVSLKVAVCWKHRPARPRRRAPHVLDWFLRRADDIINRLADYLHATGRATHPQPPGAARYDATLACQLER